jgi:hypothetical protein
VSETSTALGHLIMVLLSWCRPSLNADYGDPARSRMLQRRLAKHNPVLTQEPSRVEARMARISTNQPTMAYAARSPAPGRDRRYETKPTAMKPRIIMAQVAGSGAAAATLVNSNELSAEARMTSSKLGTPKLKVT